MKSSQSSEPKNPREALARRAPRPTSLVTLSPVLLYLHFCSVGHHRFGSCRNYCQSGSETLKDRIACLEPGYAPSPHARKPNHELMETQDREAVFPTRQSLGAMKTKLKGAKTGHDLLKRKSEALTKYVWHQLDAD